MSPQGISALNISPRVRFCHISGRRSPTEESQVGDEYSVLYGLVSKKAEANAGVDGLWWDGRYDII